ncbi:hypothetical protein KG088_17240 [Halomonas sp. TRM85114]|uniref:hypothetical protein n=1 Tax=Halomonas jincaotanensis TaxID=2810616 RepID=UPI001BD3D769|nr:hypothetical protein [Halomonas jincaotanensis]MBS9405358.1 hypothetical protein [Halomonas jincaotanensis]
MMVTKRERQALDQFASIIAEAHPDVDFGDVNEGEGGTIEVEVILNQYSKPGAEPVYAAANDVLGSHAIRIVPRVRFE